MSDHTLFSSSTPINEIYLFHLEIQKLNWLQVDLRANPFFHVVFSVRLFIRTRCVSIIRKVFRGGGGGGQKTLCAVWQFIYLTTAFWGPEISNF